MTKSIHNIYIHVPFCASKCSYCNFCTYTSCDENLHEKYINCLVNEIRSRLTLTETNHASSLQKTVHEQFKIGQLRSLYFGGGTPSLIDPKLIGGIIKEFEGNIINYGGSINRVLTKEKHQTEILLEANLQDITEEKLKQWKKAGINRLSIGVQTFQKKFNGFLERKYDFTKHSMKSNDYAPFLKSNILLAKKFFPNLSIDLIFGFPCQTLNDLKKDLGIIKVLGLKHISWYALDYKQNSRIEDKKNSALPFETVLKYYNYICSELQNQGFEQYEIYNWSKKLTNTHNLDFWQGKDYLGFGVSAVSNIGNKVIQNTKNLKKYFQQSECKEIQILSIFEQNYFLLQRLFRTTKGIEISKIRKITNKDVFEGIMKSKFIILSKRMPQKSFTKNSTEGKINLTQKGKMFFSDFFEEIFL